MGIHALRGFGTRKELSIAKVEFTSIYLTNSSYLTYTSNCEKNMTIKTVFLETALEGDYFSIVLEDDAQSLPLGYISS